MRIALTGGTGFVGGFIAAAALRAGHEVTLLSRSGPSAFAGPARIQKWRLGQVPDLAGMDALVHAAFAHVPGRYRGGEGEDPAGFLRANRDGSLRLFEAAQRAGVSTVLQLSTRAVFDGYPAGTLLTEDLAPRPASLYGEIKAELEAALAAAASPGFHGISLRATGVYGLPVVPRQRHKWSGLLEELVAGRPIPARVSTEVHGDDLATAALLLLGTRHPHRGGAAAAAPHLPSSGRMPAIAHASDIVLDNRDLALAVAGHLARDDVPLPPRSDAGRLSVLDCGTLHRLGWRSGGWPTLRQTVGRMLDDDHGGGAASAPAAAGPASAPPH